MTPTPSFPVRKWALQVEETIADGGPPVADALVKVAALAVIENPYAGRWSEELDALIDPSGELAAELVARCAAALGDRSAEGCGKAAIVGVHGEQEHGVACLTTPFGDAMRNGIGGSTWVTSTTKVAAAGASIDVPLAYKRALFVREFYDAITVAVADAPRPDEIVVIAATSSRGRVHHRVGGLAKADARQGDGLR
jgi:hypothetical protein